MQWWITPGKRSSRSGNIGGYSAGRSWAPTRPTGASSARGRLKGSRMRAIMTSQVAKFSNMCRARGAQHSKGFCIRETGRTVGMSPIQFPPVVILKLLTFIKDVTLVQCHLFVQRHLRQFWTTKIQISQNNESTKHLPKNIITALHQELLVIKTLQTISELRMNLMTTLPLI